MTKESERKKIVEAIISTDHITAKEVKENLEKAGFEFKVEEDDILEFQMNDTKVAEEGKTKKKSNI